MIKELTEVQVIEARELKAQSESWNTIGRRLGVSALTVRAAMNPEWYLRQKEKRRNDTKLRRMGVQRICGRFFT